LEFLSKTRVLAILTVGPALLLFLIINLLPIGWAVAASFHQIASLSPEWEWIYLANFSSLVYNPEFYDSVMKGLIFAGGSVVVQTVAGTALALLLNKRFRFDKFARAIGLMPYLIPTAVLGFITLWMTNSQWGIINQGLVSLGIVDEFPGWFSNQDIVMISVVLASSWKYMTFVTMMILARLQGIPEGYYEAAKTSGASAYQAFRDITLPNLKNVLFIVILLRFIWMFNKFDIIWVLTKGGPDEATRTAVIYAYKEAFQLGSLGSAGAVSTVLFALLGMAAIVYFVVFNPSEEVRVE
jgi:multiple sugar transport system permease protein